VIDFGTSEGLSEIRFEFPPPVVFDDGAGGKAYGYKEGKIFPVRFKVQQPLERGKVVVAPNASASPAKGSPPPAPAAEPKLSLNMEYGVCLRNMCVPAVAAVAMGFGEGELELGLGDRLDNAVASLPQKQAIGRGEGIGISIIQGARKPGVIELEIAARIGEGVQEAELFVEGRDPYAVVQRGAAIGGVILFKVRGDRPLPDPAPTKENPEKFGPATLTLVTPSKAVEIAVDLDAVVKPH
jgi:DsbC/DsbD-like thiol-disulfide interchange protein